MKPRKVTHTAHPRLICSLLTTCVANYVEFVANSYAITMAYDERTLDRIFAGSLLDLPPVLSKIVRIFTSSTFTGQTV